MRDFRDYLSTYAFNSDQILTPPYLFQQTGFAEIVIEIFDSNNEEQYGEFGV